MKVTIIGRTEMLYNAAIALAGAGFEIPLIVTAKAAPESAKSEKDFGELAEKLGAKFLQTGKIDSDESFRVLSAMEPMDVAVSLNYVNLIGQRTIDLFRLGILNAHGGDLPRYRGNACQAWAIVNGENRIGLCVHKMVAGQLDSGDIIAREFLPLNEDTRIGLVYEWMAESVPRLFLEAIELIRNNPEYVLAVQQEQDSLRCYPRLPEDGRISWSDTGLNILRLINASSEPFSGAFCEFENDKLIVWRAELFDDKDVYCAIPGQVARILKDGSIVVICGNGKLRLMDVEHKGLRCEPSVFVKTIRQRLR